jgi:hypothetical protein
MDMNHWKKYFLFPFAQIAPFPDLEEYGQQDPYNDGTEVSDVNFNKLVSKKY